MKSKNPSKQRVPRGAAASGGRSGTGARAITLDFVQYRIEAFNREQGGGVIGTQGPERLHLGPRRIGNADRAASTQGRPRAIRGALLEP